MALVHAYFGIENLGLTDAQRNTLVGQLRALGSAPDQTHPELLNHWRTRLDAQAAIYEALFDDTTLTVAAFSQRLVAIFGIPVGQISTSSSSPSFAAGTSSSVVVFSRPAGTQRLRVVLFGGAATSYADSLAEARGYLTTNAVAWVGP